MKPFDFMNYLKNKNVIVELQPEGRITGKLLSFDQHLNLLVELDKQKNFVRGTSVRAIKKK